MQLDNELILFIYFLLNNTPLSSLTCVLLFVLTVMLHNNLFYSLNSQDILMYVQRPGDIYQPFLIETGKLKPEQIISYKNFLTQK